MATDADILNCPTALFNGLVEKRLAEIRKSGNAPSKSKIVMKALAEDEISREYPALARAVIAEERREVARRLHGL